MQALPYLDPEPSPLAEQLVEAELASLPTPSINNEGNTALQPPTRIDVQVPTSAPPAPNVQASDAVWRQAADDACAWLEHARSREADLALQDAFGEGKWRAHAAKLESKAMEIEMEVSKVKLQVEQINEQRLKFANAISVELRATEEAYRDAAKRVAALRAAVSERLGQDAFITDIPE